ncbi:MAG: TRAP transporter small permease [Oscillospiraceae bacterium]
MRYPKFMTTINKIGAYICGFLVLATSVLAVMESILRKVFASPTTWTLNLSTGIFIWAAFLGSAWAFQELGHVSVDLFRGIADKHDKSGKRIARRVMAVFGYVVSFIVISAFLYGGWKLCVKAVALNQLAPYAFHFPLIISYLAIPVGSIQMMLTLIFIIIDICSGGEKYL